MNVEKMIIIGAGTMGSTISQIAALAEIDVYIHDISPDALDRTMKLFNKNLRRWTEKERITQGRAVAALNRNHAVESMENLPWTDTPFILEAIHEDQTAKNAMFMLLDGHRHEDAIIASDTSSISITGLAAATTRPGNVVGMHFFHPATVMPLVEVVRGMQTSDATIHATEALAKKMDKIPLHVNDHPGFCANRVLMPMVNEAIFALSEGVADAKTIDSIMKLGCRHPMGPLELADLIGLDVVLDVLELMHKNLGESKYRPCPLLRRMVQAGMLGQKSGLGFHLYSNPPEAN
jgi:3-hydroxybutyryl-CoA dehydrogenase